MLPGIMLIPHQFICMFCSTLIPFHQGVPSHGSLIWQPKLLVIP
jgi:hypothetical protein